MYEEEVPSRGPNISRPTRLNEPYDPWFDPEPTRVGSDDNIVIETHPTGITKSITIKQFEGQDNLKGNPYRKTVWLARTVNEWRIFPRLFILVYLWGLGITLTWFMGLADPSLAQSTFVSTMIGAGAAWFGLYVGTGNRKDKVE